MPAYSGLFDNGTGFPLSTTGQLNQKRVKEQLASVTVGAVAGTTATVNRTQVKPGTTLLDNNAGKVVLEAASDINRASTAQDVTNLKAQLSRQNAASFGFVRDLSGNGGPAFTRSF